MDQDQQILATGLHHLPLRVRDSSTSSSNSAGTKSSALTGSTLFHPNHPGLLHHKDTGSFTHTRKRCPETLSLLSNNHAANRIRSPTESSLGSIPDSATTYSPSTLASPLSSSYASDLQEMLHGSRPASRVLHRHRPSTATCSTFVNDEDEIPVMVDGQDHLKMTAFSRMQGMDEDMRDGRDEGTPQSASGMETLPVSPLTEAPIKEESSSPILPSVEHMDESDSKWETGSAVSDDCSPEDVDSILDFTLQLVYGVDVDDAAILPAQIRDLVQKFIHDLGQRIWHGASPQDGSQVNGGGVRNSTSSTSSSTSTPGGSGSGSGRGDYNRGGKRKKQGPGRGGGGDEDGEDLSDGDGDGYLPVKRVRPNPRDDENLRLSCPFRKRNPHRFNVRDHHSCAMTFFPKFAELRQHIVKQHKRDDPSAFVCDRCNRDFNTRKELRDHQRLPRDQMCDISDVNPESGIDGPTSNKLLSRKRASGSTPEVQWREIWNILFPDDDDNMVREYHFTPVIEHFELSNNYLSSFAFLKADLRDKMSNPATLETLATKFHQCFVETVERCIAEAQVMPYANRSNKRNEQLAAAAVTASAPPPAVNAAGMTAVFPRKPKEVAPRPDSGVVMDDGSEESGSVLGGVAPFAGRLSQRESVRTVRGARRGSSLVPPPTTNSGTAGRNSFILPPSRVPSAIFDGGSGRNNTPPTSLPTIPSTSMGAALDHETLAPTDVQAWTHGVPFPQAYEPVPDSFVPPVSAEGGMGMHHSDFAAWAQAFYPTMGIGSGVDEFAGFQGR